MKNTALITGSYGGFGACFADIHAKNGGDLILVGRRQDKLDKQANDLAAKYKITVETIAVDLAKDNAADVLYEACKEKQIIPDIIINNAGFGGQGDFARERTMEQDMSMLAVNVLTPTKILKLFLPDMIQKGSGKVLNVSSIASKMPGPLQAVYFATKAYVTSWSNALSRELKGTGVTVTALMPGATRTGFANTAGLNDTKLFANPVEPYAVAQKGYEGMIKGKMNVMAGLHGWQRPIMAIAPLFPKKILLDFVYDQQIAGGEKRS